MILLHATCRTELDHHYIGFTRVFPDSFDDLTVTLVSVHGALNISKIGVHAVFRKRRDRFFIAQVTNYTGISI